MHAAATQAFDNIFIIYINFHDMINCNTGIDYCLRLRNSSRKTVK